MEKIEKSLFAVLITLLFLFPACTKKMEMEISAKDTRGKVIQIKKGSTVKITAQGKTSTNPNDPNCPEYTGPDGLANCVYNKNPGMHGIPHLALSGIFNGEYFYIGSQFEKKFEKDGELVLIVNDDYKDDNKGFYNVKVEIR